MVGEIVIDFEVIVENVWTYFKPLRSIDQKLLNDLDSVMSYQISEYARFRKTYVEFNYSLLDRQNLRYPTGLYTDFHKVLELRNLTYDLIDKRTPPNLSNKLSIRSKPLRDYQREVVDNAIKSERGIIKVATGGGKTVIAANIIADLNLKTMFIVNSLDLLEQAYDEFSEILGIKIGRVGGGYCDIQQINVCTVQTLHSALGLKYEAADKEYFLKEQITVEVLTKKDEIRNLVKESELIIVDEVHHLRADSYVSMMANAENAHFKFGCSGTPYKLDSTDILLKAYAGKEIANISASYLIDRKFLVCPEIYFLDPNELPEYKYVKGSFRTTYNDWIVDNADRNKLILDCVRRFVELNKSTLITVSQIRHGETLAELIINNLKGINVEFIKGEVKKDKRKEMLNSIRERKLNVLIGTSLADEGLDIPALDAAIIAGGGKSMIKTLQRVGRTLRPYPNVENNIKEKALIVDFYDHLRYLTGQSRKRMKIYQQEPRFKIFKSFK
jgi:superfamily II DNA or RNA helicase